MSFSLNKWEVNCKFHLQDEILFSLPFAVLQFGLHWLGSGSFRCLSSEITHSQYLSRGEHSSTLLLSFRLDGLDHHAQVNEREPREKCLHLVVLLFFQ